MDTYTSPEYQPNDFVGAFANVPRFGHPIDFSLLYSSEKSDEVNYALGTIFIGVLLFTIFLTWSILLCIFMCVGPKKVGFLAGFRMKRPAMKEGCFLTPIIIRSIFTFSSMIIFTFVILLSFFYGLRNGKNATDGFLDYFTEIDELTTEGDEASLAVLELAIESANLRDLMVDELRLDQFCSNEQLDDEPIDVHRNELVQNLYSMGDFGVANFTVTRTIFDEVGDYVQDLDRLVGTFGIESWHSWSISVIFSSIVLTMMSGVVLASSGRTFDGLSCVNTWFLLPLFLILISISWIGVSLLSIGGVMTADFCSGSSIGSPEGTILNILEYSEITIDLEYAIRYWIDGCKNDLDFPALSAIDDYVKDLNLTLTSIENLSMSMDSITLDELSDICGNDFEAVRGYLDIMSQDYAELVVNATRVEDILSCSTVNPIYIEITHRTLCSEVPEAIVWTFAFLLSICVFGMVVITFRSAWLNVIDERNLPPFLPVEMTDQKYEVEDDSPKPLNLSPSNTLDIEQSETKERGMFHGSESGNALVDNSPSTIADKSPVSSSNGLSVGSSITSRSPHHQQDVVVRVSESDKVEDQVTNFVPMTNPETDPFTQSTVDNSSKEINSKESNILATTAGALSTTTNSLENVLHDLLGDDESQTFDPMADEDTDDDFDLLLQEEEIL